MRLEEAFPADITPSAERLLVDGSSNTLGTHEFSVDEGPKRRWFEARFRPQPEGTLLIITRDTTERHQAKARIERLAYFDSLTGLPNRQLFLVKSAQRIKRARGRNEMAAVLYVDLDRFKRINDNLGHAVGDAMFKTIAHRLRDLKTDIVARIGGDEFAATIHSQ